MASISVTTLFILLASFVAVNSQRRRLSAGVTAATEFDCPDEFGYYPHPADCTQYYVCVFGGALLESCTGGLMYSHELQTCDWPRNVGCSDGRQQAHIDIPRGRAAPGSRTSSVSTSPLPVRLQDHQRKPQQQQFPLYTEDLGPAGEQEEDRPQRVYRGQPSTVGQVARDRDGLYGVTNSIPASSGSRGSNDKVLTYSNQQYRTETPRAPSVAPAVNYYSGSNSSYDSQYDPYYSYEDVEIYRDSDYSNAGNPSPATKQTYGTSSGSSNYRGSTASTYSPPAPPAAAPAAPASSSAYQNQPFLKQVEDDYSDYDDYSQSAEKKYQPVQVTRTPSRNSLDGFRYSPALPAKSTYSSTTSTTTSTTTTTTTTTTPPPTTARSSSGRVRTRVSSGNSNSINASPAPSRVRVRPTVSPVTEFNQYLTEVSKPNQSRGSSKNQRGSSTAARNRGTVTYTTSDDSPSPVEAVSNRGSGYSGGRSRPTLKPSTSIVSKASEAIDVYKFPPSRPAPIYPQPRADQPAAKCRKDVCLLPDCYCGGKDIPGDMDVQQVPQMVLLTFDDSVNDLNKELYKSLFEKERANPNGCPISGTFYVSHEWTDYSQVQNLYADGHEIASHSISHSFGEQFSTKKWTKEIAGQREILAAYGGVRLEDVRGMRAPFLAVGGNKMFKMLYDANFTYDSSMPIYENRPPSWPYTIDYKLFHDCMIPPCPTKSYPGLWEVPMVMWQDLNGGRCSMGDACSNPPTADGVYKMLIKNFERHYTTNRAPFGLFYHAAWFTHPHHKEGFEAFLDTIVSMDDVWLVTNWQAIQWMRDPTPISRMNGFQPFQCNYPERPRRCNNPKVCNLWHKSGVRYMRTCQPCPDVYPWTGRTGVRNSRVDNSIDEQ